MKRQSYERLLEKYLDEECIRFGNHLLKNYFQLGSYWGRRTDNQLPPYDSSKYVTTEQAFEDYKNKENEK